MTSRVRWLQVAAAVTAVSGLLIAGSVVSTVLDEMLRAAVDLVFWPIDDLQSVDHAATRILSAITGGLLVGLGVLFWIIATDVLPTQPLLARKLVIGGIGSWFLVDSSMSIAAGGALNVLFNIGFLLLFTLPVLMPGASSAE